MEQAEAEARLELTCEDRSLAVEGGRTMCAEVSPSTFRSMWRERAGVQAEGLLCMHEALGLILIASKEKSESQTVCTTGEALVAQEGEENCTGLSGDMDRFRAKSERVEVCAQWLPLTHRAACDGDRKMAGRFKTNVHD